VAPSHYRPGHWCGRGGQADRVACQPEAALWAGSESPGRRPVRMHRIDDDLPGARMAKVVVDEDRGEGPGGDAQERQLAETVVRAQLANFFLNRRLFEEVEPPLREEGLGRLHHRILFFVSRSPGLTVGELTATLGVSHQNIRVQMKELVDRGYLQVRTGPPDRRQRRLSATAAGHQLANEMHARQGRRLRRALEKAEATDVDGFLRVHDLMLDPADRDAIERAVAHRPD
jgi:DNA-binding MarR family transcriptional regulator